MTPPKLKSQLHIPQVSTGWTADFFSLFVDFYLRLHASCVPASTSKRLIFDDRVILGIHCQMSAPQPSSPEEHDPLDLTSLDADSLFTALGAVDRVRLLDSPPAHFHAVLYPC